MAKAKEVEANSNPLAQLSERLSAPMAASEVHYKPEVFSGKKDKVQISCYIDARSVIQRLNDVVPFAWQDSYAILYNGEDKMVIECSLTVIVDGIAITRKDVGENSNKGGEASRQKSAYSDAFKRAAVKFGVGLFVYSLPKVWVACESYETSRGTKHRISKAGHDHASKAIAAALKAMGADTSTSPVAEEEEEDTDPTPTTTTKPEPKASDEPKLLIEGLIDELKSKGKGQAAALVVTKYKGIPTDVETMRKMYRELKGLTNQPAEPATGGDSGEQDKPIEGGQRGALVSWAYINFAIPKDAAGSDSRAWLWGMMLGTEPTKTSDLTFGQAAEILTSHIPTVSQLLSDGGILKAKRPALFAAIKDNEFSLIMREGDINPSVWDATWSEFKAEFGAK